MKNLKKVLALALVFALSLSLFAGAAFTDQADIDKDYSDDVNMLVELGVLGGYPDGSFKPEGNITRAEFTKMAYTVKYGYDDQGQLFAGSPSKFTDVQNDANLKWAKGYINYCSTQNIIGGVGNNKFNPNGNVTVAEASKMLLVILGCDPIKEGFGGSNWVGNVVSKAMDLGVFDGWVGDPTAPATRQLVAKLMKNTIFAPTFVYNPITGVGSQVSPLDPSVKNETLGEKTMGLKHISGLVVANENYAIARDEEGDAVPGVAPQAKGKSQVYYEYVQTNGAVVNRIAVIDRALPDSTLGNLVDVYFTADGKEGSYANIKVIGNVIASAKTVVYDVCAGDIKIMPDNSSTSTRMVQPYISFTVDGTEHKVEQRISKNSTTNVIKVPSNTQYTGEVFADLMFFAPSTARDLSRGILTQPSFKNGVLDNTDAAVMIKEMKGVNTIQKYRFVSVDGGETFAYIFKTSKVEKGNVSSINDSTVSISAIGGSKDLDEVILKDDLAKGDNIVAYMEDGKPAVEKAEVITGKASIKPGNIATIGDADYKADVQILGKEIGDYLKQNNNNNENTQFIVYNGYILDVDGSAHEGELKDYAVVIASSYDASMGTAKVKLAYADDTEGVYEVSKVYGNDQSKLKDFAGNAMVGAIYKFSIKNGMVDLSAEEAHTATTTVGGISNAKFSVGGSSYSASPETVLFLLYGGDGTTTRTAIKAKAYKLEDMPDMSADAVAYPNASQVYVDATFGSFVESTSSTMRTLLVGAMSAGKKEPTVVPMTDTVAYLLSARQQYNFDSSEWYLTVKMIGDKGLIDTTSVDDLSGFKFEGNIDTEPKDYTRGTMVRYKLDSDNKITSFSNDLGKISDMAVTLDTTKTIQNGFYYVNIAEIRGNLLGFYPYGVAVDLVNNKLPATSNTLTLDKEYDVVAIDNGDFIEGGDVETVSNYSAITATQKNAIVQISSEKVIRIISLHNEY